MNVTDSYTEDEPQIVVTYKAIGKLGDRSGLSQEMRELCANLPIYRVVKQNDTADMIKRVTQEMLI